MTEHKTFPGAIVPMTREALEHGVLFLEESGEMVFKLKLRKAPKGHHYPHEIIDLMIIPDGTEDV